VGQPTTQILDVYFVIYNNMGIFKTINQKKKAAEGFLQNYGANIRNNININSAEFQKKRGTHGFNNYQTKNPFPNPFKRSSYKRPK